MGIRERVAIPEDRLVRAHQAMRRDFGVKEGVIVSTCNRVEVITHCPGSANPVEAVKRFLYAYHSMSAPLLDDYLYSYREEAAVKHVFRVASSLDSMVVGEPQILGQMKRAYAAARQAGSVGAYLNSLMHRAFFVAKRVRRETQISASAVSVSYVAVELARKIFGDLERKSIFLLGAGKMSELAAQNLLNSGVSRIFISNRTAEKARQLAHQFKGTAVPFNELDPYLLQSDIVLVSTGADSFVLDRSRLQRVIRRRKYAPLFIIDISVPRNVDPRANEIENVFVYDIDDLRCVADANLEERRREATLAEEIVDEEVYNYVRRVASYNFAPLIASLKNRIEGLCLEELEKQRDSMSADEYDRAARLMRKTAGKLAHPLIMQIKQPQENPNLHVVSLEIIKKMFQLEEE